MLSLDISVRLVIITAFIPFGLNDEPDHASRNAVGWQQLQHEVHFLGQPGKFKMQNYNYRVLIESQSETK